MTVRIYANQFVQLKFESKQRTRYASWQISICSFRCCHGSSQRCKWKPAREIQLYNYRMNSWGANNWTMVVTMATHGTHSRPFSCSGHLSGFFAFLGKRSVTRVLLFAVCHFFWVNCEKGSFVSLSYHQFILRMVWIEKSYPKSQNCESWEELWISVWQTMKEDEVEINMQIMRLDKFASEYTNHKPSNK